MTKRNSIKPPDGEVVFRSASWVEEKADQLRQPQLDPTLLPLIAGFTVLLLLIIALGNLSVRRLEDTSREALNVEHQHAAKATLLLQLRVALTRLDNEARDRMEAARATNCNLFLICDCLPRAGKWRTWCPCSIIRRWLKSQNGRRFAATWPPTPKSPRTGRAIRRMVLPSSATWTLNSTISSGVQTPNKNRFSISAKRGKKPRPVRSGPGTCSRFSLV